MQRFLDDVFAHFLLNTFAGGVRSVQSLWNRIVSFRVTEHRFWCSHWQMSRHCECETECQTDIACFTFDESTSTNTCRVACLFSGGHDELYFKRIYYFSTNLHFNTASPLLLRCGQFSRLLTTLSLCTITRLLNPFILYIDFREYWRTRSHFIIRKLRRMPFVINKATSWWSISVIIVCRHVVVMVVCVFLSWSCAQRLEPAMRCSVHGRNSHRKLCYTKHTNSSRRWLPLCRYDIVFQLFGYWRNFEFVNRSTLIFRTWVRRIGSHVVDNPTDEMKAVASTSAWTGWGSFRFRWLRQLRGELRTTQLVITHHGHVSVSLDIAITEYHNGSTLYSSI